MVLTISESEFFGDISDSDNISHRTFSNVGEPLGSRSRSIQSKGELLRLLLSMSVVARLPRLVDWLGTVKLSHDLDLEEELGKSKVFC